MKVAVYGNNLNQGYFIVSFLRERGIEATLFAIQYAYKQEHHDWWTQHPLKSDWLCQLPSSGLNIGKMGKLTSDLTIPQLYNQVRKHDVLLMMEDGPAVFSELSGIRKVFLSLGSDLQILPFLTSIYRSPTALLQEAKSGVGLVSWLKAPYQMVKRHLQFSVTEKRQRAGLRQCDALICTPQQTHLIDELDLDPSKVTYLPIPMDDRILKEVDVSLVRKLEQNYAKYDFVFLHPTRQFYLKQNNDIFLKDNDKLIEGYAQFLKQTKSKSILLLINKGREQDIENTRKLISRHRIDQNVEWIDELDNRSLRAYYSLENVVVCDQYSPNVAILGNIGREATFYGRILITAFLPENRLIYGDDMPAHVFRAETADQVFNAMKRVDALSKEDIRDLSVKTRQWYYRHLNHDAVMPKMIQVLTSGQSVS